MRKKFELESITVDVVGQEPKHNMVFSAYDESNQCFVKMVLVPTMIKTINKGGTLKIIQGEIKEIVRYV